MFVSSLKDRLKWTMCTGAVSDAVANADTGHQERHHFWPLYDVTKKVAQFTCK